MKDVYSFGGRPARPCGTWEVKCLLSSYNTPNDILNMIVTRYIEPYKYMARNEKVVKTVAVQKRKFLVGLFLQPCWGM